MLETGGCAEHDCGEACSNLVGVMELVSLRLLSPGPLAPFRVPLVKVGGVSPGRICLSSLVRLMPLAVCRRLIGLLVDSVGSRQIQPRVVCPTGLSPLGTANPTATRSMELLGRTISIYITRVGAARAGDQSTSEVSNSRSAVLFPRVSV